MSLILSTMRLTKRSGEKTKMVPAARNDQDRPNNDEENAQAGLVGLGARHPRNKPPDGPLSHEHDDPQQLDDKQTENEDIYDDDQQTVPDHSSNKAETGPGCEKFKQGDIRFHLTRDKTGQATLNLRKLSTPHEETGKKRESKITTMRRKLMESRKSKEYQDARKVKVITNRVVKTY